MNVCLTVLCENSVGRPIRAVGEHGFACFVESDSGNFLFDTGQGIGIRRNAQVLGKDLESIRGIVLSHGHHDHTGGLLDVLGQSGPIDVFAHPECFKERYWVGLHEKRPIGIPHSKSLLETVGARFILRRDFCEIAPGFFLTGEVPRTTSFEKGDPHLMSASPVAADLEPDPFRDDFSLVIDSPQGLILLLGCAHAGVVNIMRHVLSETGRDRIHAVVGGTHLGPADEKQFAATLEAFKDFGVEKIGVSHCTGQIRAAQMQSAFPGRFFFASVGSTLEA